MAERILEIIQGPIFSRALAEHLRLSVAALVVAVLIALPLAALVSQSPLGSLLAINISNIGRAVPSLAILALALPFLGLGFRPALLALTLLAIPPILINAAIGLREVPSSVVESARGMGMSGLQILTRIRLPIAAPVIFAGLRTSAVQVVASATLATFIGGGGLGGLIVRGLQRNSPEFQLAGAIPVALLAMATELGFGGLQRALTPKGLRVGSRSRAA
ncbi:MAG: ABC transporter permease [Chloroflexota bacterium]|nr:ABC transporter permease [Chloroflexota bacterium]